MPVDSFDMETSNSTVNEAVPGRQRPSRLAQFAAVLKKNFILQTRSRKAFFGIGGWAALLIEMFIPGLFFLLMCIPKYYIPLSPSPRQLPGPPYSLDSNTWARPYHGASYSCPSCTPLIPIACHACTQAQLNAAKHSPTFLCHCRPCRTPPPQQCICTVCSKHNSSHPAHGGVCQASSLP